MNVNAALEGRTFGELLRRARVERALTQRQAADIVGVTPVTVSRWESNQSGVVQRQHRLAVARFLDISEKQLYELLGLPWPESKVVRLFAGRKDTGSDSVQPRGGAAPGPLSPQQERAIGAIAARIETGTPLTPEDVEGHKNLLRAVELLPGGAGSPEVDS